MEPSLRKLILLTTLAVISRIPTHAQNAAGDNQPAGRSCGYPYVLQGNPNLVDPTQWVPLQTYTADVIGGCRFTLTNLTAPGFFYRVALP